jgi:LacI family transcriptional regulator
MSVPRDLSITGINDAEYAGHLTPPLTTIRLPADEIGDRAAEYLLACIDRRPTTPAWRVQFDLIVRDSTAPAPARRRSKSIA